MQITWLYYLYMLYSATWMSSMLRIFKRNLFAVLLIVAAGFAVADDSGDNTNALPPGVVPTPTSQTLGQPPSSQNQYNQMMEKCKVVDQDGNGLIKAYMADSGINLQGDASAWIWVPYGMCKQINAGNYDGVPPEILAKINTQSNVQTAPTLGD